MANRAYLYSHHPEEELSYRDLGEWNYEVPVVHLLLVGANSSPCPSAIWQVEQKIAIQGDAPKGRSLVLQFLDWLVPQLPDAFSQAADTAKAFLTRPDRQGRHYHLEPGEIYEGMGLGLAAMERETLSMATLAQDLFHEVTRLLEETGTSLDDANHERLKDLENKWEKTLGLGFSDAVYHHLGG